MVTMNEIVIGKSIKEFDFAKRFTKILTKKEPAIFSFPIIQTSHKSFLSRIEFNTDLIFHRKVIMKKMEKPFRLKQKGFYI